jgi:hypothetical protein
MMGMDEPFFDEMGDSIRIHRGSKEPSIWGYYYFVWPVIFGLGLLIYFVIFQLESLAPIIFFNLVLGIALAFLYLSRNTEPAMTFELTSEAARTYYLGGSAEMISEVVFDERTTADIILHEGVYSEGFGKLYGFTFERDGEVVGVSGFDDWDIWDIQSLRDPVFKVVDHHKLDRGVELANYMDGLAGVIPFRRRTV